MTRAHPVCPIVHDAWHWRARAVEARVLAENYLSAEGRAAMLTVAAEYEKLAERAATRGQSSVRSMRNICGNE